MPVKPLEHFLFRNYSVAVKNWLQESLYLSSYPEDNNITVVYMTPDRAWAKYIYPTLNGATTSPNANFHLTGMEYINGQNMLGFVREYSKYPDKNKLKSIKPPLIYSLTYSLTLYARVQSEMDVMLYQLISQAHKNAKANFIVDGQWAELMAGDPRQETNLEPGEAQGIIQRFGIDLIIPRAYLPLGFSEEDMILTTDMVYDI